MFFCFAQHHIKKLGEDGYVHVSEKFLQSSSRLLSQPFSYNNPVVSICVCVLKSEACTVANINNNIMYSVVLYVSNLIKNTPGVKRVAKN